MYIHAHIYIYTHVNVYDIHICTNMHTYTCACVCTSETREHPLHSMSRGLQRCSKRNFARDESLRIDRCTPVFTHACTATYCAYICIQKHAHVQACCEQELLESRGINAPAQAQVPQLLQLAVGDLHEVLKDEPGDPLGAGRRGEASRIGARTAATGFRSKFSFSFSILFTSV